MRPLWPSPERREVAPEEVYALDVGRPEGRSWARVNMICTLDGALAAGGRAGPIAGPPDKKVFSILRGMADVVLVGAGTVRTENYGRVRLSPEVQQVRRERGQAPLPTLAIVSRSGRLSWEGRLAETPGPLPLLFLPPDKVNGGPEGRGGGPKVVPAGQEPGQVNLGAVMDELYARGLHHVLCEGGPSLNASLAAAGLLDELCLTLSPKLAGHVGGSLVGGWLGSGERWLASTGEALATGFSGDGGTGPGEATQLVDLRLHSLYEDGGYLFLRLKIQHPPEE